MLTVVGPLQFDRWNVAAELVEAVVVEPVDPSGGGVFDLVDRVPGLAGVYQLGLVEPVDGFGERVVPRRQVRSIRSVISELLG